MWKSWNLIFVIHVVWAEICDCNRHIAWFGTCWNQFELESHNLAQQLILKGVEFQTLFSLAILVTHAQASSKRERAFLEKRFCLSDAQAWHSRSSVKSTVLHKPLCLSHAQAWRRRSSVVSQILFCLSDAQAWLARSSVAYPVLFCFVFFFFNFSCLPWLLYLSFAFFLSTFIACHQLAPNCFVFS